MTTCNHCGRERGHLPGCPKHPATTPDGERVVRLRAKARRLQRQGRVEEAESYDVQADCIAARAALEAAGESAEGPASARQVYKSRT
jgi:hypothetical protein